MRITKQVTSKFKYAFLYDFNMELLAFCRGLKEGRGYKVFNWTGEAWRFNDVSIALEIQEKFPEVALDANMYDDLILHEKEKEESEKKKLKATELKNATTSDLEIQGINGELFPYQKIGVEFFINNNGRAILADQCGIGKTLQALAYITHTKKNKTLVVCPASVKYSWEGEVLKWTKLRPFVVNASTGINDSEWNNHDIIIINYDIIKKYFDFLYNKRIDCAVLDEFHNIKNSKAVRTKATTAIVKRCESILLLSATPMMNRTEEMFNGLSLMDPIKWNNWYTFTRRYCAGHQGDYGYDCKGSSNLDELHEIIGGYFLRRNKEEVLKDLPKKISINMPIEMNVKEKKEYELAERNFVTYLKDIKKKKKTEIEKSMRAEKLAKLNEMRKITTMGKLYAAKELINNILDSGEKLVVFSVYREPLELLHEEYKDKSVLLIGGVEMLARKKMIEDFQNDDKTKIFFGGLKSAGVGITLTRAQNVVFLDFSWVPADHVQGMDRIHRIGSTSNSVNIYQLFSRGTIDEYMATLLSQKTKVFDELIEGKKKDESSDTGDMLNEILDYLENK